MLKALYSGKLPICGQNLNCVVLNNETRVITLTDVFRAFGINRSGGNKTVLEIPSFLQANNLKPYISSELLEVMKKITYFDGDKEKTGYNALVIPRMCKMYLDARRNNALLPKQKKFAVQSEILLSAISDIGIVALVDEATGFQWNRKHDALRVLLQAYVNEKIAKWLKRFPDAFFNQLDKLYGNEKTTSRSRPPYYGRFINTYVYEPIENFEIISIQIGRVIGLMEVSPNLRSFKKEFKIIKPIKLTELSNQ